MWMRAASRLSAPFQKSRRASRKARRPLRDGRTTHNHGYPSWTPPNPSPAEWSPAEWFPVEARSRPSGRASEEVSGWGTAVRSPETPNCTAPASKEAPVVTGRGTEDRVPPHTHSLTRVWICCCRVCWVASNSSCGEGSRHWQVRVRPQTAQGSPSPAPAPPASAHRMAVQLVAEALGEFVQTLLGTESQRESRRGAAGPPCPDPAPLWPGPRRPQADPPLPSPPRGSLHSRPPTQPAPGGRRGPPTYRHHGLGRTQTGQVTNASNEGAAGRKVMAATFQEAVTQFEELRSNRGEQGVV